MARTTAPPAAVIPQREDPAKAYDRLQHYLEAEHEKVARSLAASNLDERRFFAVTDQALRRQPKLLTCTPASIVRALLDAAELGLIPSGLLGQAYLVPYRNRSTGRMECQLIPGYLGLADLARRSGIVTTIKAAMVRQRDVFEYEERQDGPWLRHVPYLNRQGSVESILDGDGAPVLDGATGLPMTKLMDGGPYLAAYMRARLSNGEAHVEFMPIAEVDGIRRRSKAADDGPWVTDYAEMGKKTVTRRGLKYLPRSIDSLLTRALELEDRAEAEAAAIRPATADARLAFQQAVGITAGEADDTEPQQQAEDEDQSAVAEPTESDA